MRNQLPGVLDTTYNNIRSRAPTATAIITHRAIREGSHRATPRTRAGEGCGA